MELDADILATLFITLSRLRLIRLIGLLKNYIAAKKLNCVMKKLFTEMLYYYQYY